MSNKKVLMIEDDRVFADIHMRIMSESAFTAVHVVSGDEIIRRVEAEKPDLIVLSISLSQHDGFAVLEALRKDASLKRVPIIILSRLSTKEDIDRAFELGATEYMIKAQHTPEDVVLHIKKLLTE